MICYNSKSFLLGRKMSLYSICSGRRLDICSHHIQATWWSLSMLPNRHDFHNLWPQYLCLKQSTSRRNNYISTLHFNSRALGKLNLINYGVVWNTIVKKFTAQRLNWMITSVAIWLVKLLQKFTFLGSPKVTDFGINLKRAYDFLLAFNNSCLLYTSDAADE